MNKKGIITLLVISALLIGGIAVASFTLLSNTTPDTPVVDGDGKTASPDSPPNQVADEDDKQNTPEDGQMSSNNGAFTDRDTGEYYNPDGEQTSTGWTDPRASKVILFGTNQLSEALYEKRAKIGSLLDDIKSSLYLYSDARLKNTFTTLTVIPDSIEVTNSEVRANVRLGQTNTTTQLTAKILIDTTGNQHAHIIIGEKLQQYGGTLHYLSRLISFQEESFTIRQKNTTKPSIEVSGNKEAALSYIKGLGYKVPDLVISFADYRSPFE